MKKKLVAVVAALLTSACSSGTGPTEIPDLSGKWNGLFTVSSCSEQPAFVNFCSALGSGNALVLTLTQTNDQVSGTLQLATTQTAVTGNVSRSGSLTLSGNGLVLADHARMTLTAWQAMVDQSNTMSGSLRYAIASILPFTGSADVVGMFAGVRR